MVERLDFTTNYARSSVYDTPSSRWQGFERILGLWLVYFDYHWFMLTLTTRSLSLIRRDHTIKRGVRLRGCQENTLCPA